MTKLRATVKTLDSVEEAFRPLYEQSGDLFVLAAVDEKSYKETIEEFRSNNINYAKQAKEFENIDVDKYKQMSEQIEALEDEKLRASGNLEALHNKKIDALENKYGSLLEKATQQSNEKEKELLEYKKAINTNTISNAITSAVTEASTVRQGALPDILHRASNVFSINSEGQLEAKDSTGNLMMSKEGGALQPSEWAKNLVSDAPFFFESSTGGGATGSTALPATGTTVINASDSDSISANLEGIASGAVIVKTV